MKSSQYIANRQQPPSQWLLQFLPWQRLVIAVLASAFLGYCIPKIVFQLATGASIWKAITPPLIDLAFLGLASLIGYKLNKIMLVAGIFATVLGLMVSYWMAINLSLIPASHLNDWHVRMGAYLPFVLTPAQYLLNGFLFLKLTRAVGLGRKATSEVRSQLTSSPQIAPGRLQ